MTSNMSPFPQYQDSGVTWLMQIPGHWKVLPGKACFKEKKIPNKGLKEKTVLSLSYGQLIVKPPEKLHGLVPESFETYQIVDIGDIICRPTDLQNDINSLRFGLSRNRGIITSAYLCFQPNKLISKDYAHLLLHAYDLKKVFYGLGSGLRQNLDWRDFKYLPCLVPPLEEQNAIVRFLDYTDKRIKRYIRAKQKLIKLLNEQKQAIIHQAVTRGLNPDVRLRPSGVEWLGDIPEHWETKRLKRITLFSYGESLPSDLRQEGPYFVFGSNGHVGTHTNSNTDAPCIIIGRKGSFGKINFSEHPVFAIDTTFIIDRRSTFNNLRWLYYLLGWMKLDSVSKDSAVPGLDRTEAYSQVALLPPINEQSEIANFLDKQIANKDKNIVMINNEIVLIKEYRTRLIADVVTGKLDVREAASQLPQELEEFAETPEEEILAEENPDPVEVEEEM